MLVRGSPILVCLNKTNEMNETDRMNQINQTNHKRRGRTY